MARKTALAWDWRSCKRSCRIMAARLSLERTAAKQNDFPNRAARALCRRLARRQRAQWGCAVSRARKARECQRQFDFASGSVGRACHLFAMCRLRMVVQEDGVKSLGTSAVRESRLRGLRFYLLRTIGLRAGAPRRPVATPMPTAAMSAVRDLQDQVRQLRAMVDEMRAENAESRAEMQQLRQELQTTRSLLLLDSSQRSTVAARRPMAAPLRVPPTRICRRDRMPHPRCPLVRTGSDRARGARSEAGRIHVAARLQGR